MSIRVVNRRKLNKVSVGDMRDIITLYRIVLKPTTSLTSFGSKHAIEEVVSNVWCSIESINPYIQKGEVNIEDRPTHMFKIRYMQGIEIDDDVRILDINENAYRILDIDNKENRNEYWFIKAKLLGPYDKEVNT